MHGVSFLLKPIFYIKLKLCIRRGYSTIISSAGAGGAVPQVNLKREHANITPTWTNSVSVSVCVTGSVAFRLFSFAPTLVCSVLQAETLGAVYFSALPARRIKYMHSRRRNRTMHESNLVLCEGKINYTRRSPGAALCLCVDECRAQREKDMHYYFSLHGSALTTLLTYFPADQRVFFPSAKVENAGLLSLSALALRLITFLGKYNICPYSS
jgi:hypothetical protein